MGPNIWKAMFSSRKEEVSADMTVTDEDDEVPMKTENVRPVHIEIQRRIDSGLHVLEWSTTECRIEALVEIDSVGVLKDANQEAT